MKINPLGTVKGDKHLFCGDLCGQGCTHSEYNRVLGEAYAAEASMPGWEGKVWENLGWFWCLERTAGDVTWHLSLNPRGLWECYSYGLRQHVWTVGYATPQEAVEAAVNALTLQISAAADGIRTLTGKQL